MWYKLVLSAVYLIHEYHFKLDEVPYCILLGYCTYSSVVKLWSYLIEIIEIIIIEITFQFIIHDEFCSLRQTWYMKFILTSTWTENQCNPYQYHSLHEKGKQSDSDNRLCNIVPLFCRSFNVTGTTSFLTTLHIPALPLTKEIISCSFSGAAKYMTELSWNNINYFTTGTL